jgi:hypothetical protein
MSEKIDFKYFLNGKKVDKSEVNLESDITIKVEGDIVYVTSNPLGYLSTRHKQPPGGFNKDK